MLLETKHIGDAVEFGLRVFNVSLRVSLYFAFVPSHTFLHAHTHTLWCFELRRIWFDKIFPIEITCTRSNLPSASPCCRMSTALSHFHLVPFYPSYAYTRSHILQHCNEPCLVSGPIRKKQSALNSIVSVLLAMYKLKHKHKHNIASKRMHNNDIKYIFEPLWLIAMIRADENAQCPTNFTVVHNSAFDFTSIRFAIHGDNNNFVCYIIFIGRKQFVHARMPQPTDLSHSLSHSIALSLEEH